MATLYELTGQFLDIYNMDLDDETKADTLDSIDWQTNYEEKIENCIKVVRNKEADIEARKSEIERLTNLNKADKRANERMLERIKSSMQLTGRDKVNTSLFKVSFRKSKAVEVEDLLLPESYKVATWKPDKKRIKEDLKNGLEILGAKLVENQNLIIK